MQATFVGGECSHHCAILIETLVIALHPDVAVDVKSDRVEFFQQVLR